MTTISADQKRDFFRFEDTLHAFIMPLDHENREARDPYAVFSAHISHPVLARAIQVRADCLARARAARALEEHDQEYLTLADHVLDLAKTLIETELAQLQNWRYQVRELSEGGLAFEGAGQQSVGQRLAVMLVDEHNAFVHLAIGEVKHCRLAAESIHIVGVQLTHDLANAKLWQQFVRSRQVLQRSEFDPE